MNKYFLHIACAINILFIAIISACPCGFSPDDTRPFFEQYEKEIVPQPTDEKEKPCSK